MLGRRHCDFCALNGCLDWKGKEVDIGIDNARSHLSRVDASVRKEDCKLILLIIAHVVQVSLPEICRLAPGVLIFSEGRSLWMKLE